MTIIVTLSYIILINEKEKKNNYTRNLACLY